VVESGASVLVDPNRINIRIPSDFVAPADGLNIRWPDGILEQEARILDWKVYAALAYVRANGLDKLIFDSPKARLGIITAGKSYGDVMQALADLGIDAQIARDIGLRVYKVAMTWPLEPQGARRFAEGLEEVLVVEEKRQLIEYQIKEELYNWKESVRAPRVVGKFDDSGGMEPQRRQARRHVAATRALRAFPSHGGPRHRQEAGKAGHDRSARVAVPRTARVPRFQGEVARQAQGDCGQAAVFLLGLPAQHFHPRAEGSRATAGIGCHFMAVWMDRNTATLHPHGRRGRAVDWPGTVYRREAHLRQPRRRHLLPLWPARDPRRSRGQGHDDLQDPVQRRGRDDRRPAPRRAARPRDDLAADRRRRREADRSGHRRAGEVPARHQLGAGRHDPSPRRA
jgi:indolepyruvate ferredoxin oxidoreductase